MAIYYSVPLQHNRVTSDQFESVIGAKSGSRAIESSRYSAVPLLATAVRRCDKLATNELASQFESIKLEPPKRRTRRWPRSRCTLLRSVHLAPCKTIAASEPWTNANSIQLSCGTEICRKLITSESSGNCFASNNNCITSMPLEPISQWT